MSFDLSFHNKSFQESMQIQSPDTSLNHFYATKLNKSSLFLNNNNNSSSNLDSFTKLNLQATQQLPKYSANISFSRHDSGNDSQLTNSAAQMKAFKDVDSIKQHVLNTSLISSDKVVIDAMIGHIKEMTSGLFETIKSLSNELINMNARYETINVKLTDLATSNRTKDEQICKLSNQIEMLNHKLEVSATSSRMNQDSLALKHQKQSELNQIDLVNKLDRMMTQKMNEFINKSSYQQNETCSKLNQKLNDLKEVIESKEANTSLMNRSVSENKLNAFVSICQKYKRIRNEKQKKEKSKLLVASKSKIKKQKPIIKNKFNLDKTSLKLANTFNMLSLGNELKWSRLKENLIVANNSNSDDEEEFSLSKTSVFDLTSY